MKTYGKAVLVIMAIFITVFIIRQIIISVGNTRALEALSSVQTYSSDYYSKSETYEGFCTDEKVSSLIQPFISKPKVTENEELDKQYKLIEEQTGGRVYCFGDKERYEVNIRFRLNNVLARYCKVRNIDEKPYCSHNTP
ncbi:MAG TPA: hypothetical protein PLQ20_01970 [Candidatus Paceibacterota bacterium]|nr:hypothetical protein [Candidatus Paceibacterota bacterium]